MIGHCIVIVLSCRAPRTDSAGPVSTPTGTAGTSTSATSTTSGASALNVLLISIDTLRKDRVRPEHMPWLTGLQLGGERLERHLSWSSWTYPSMLAALTGQDTISLGFDPGFRDDRFYEAVPEGVTLLAGRLGPRGYDTALVSASPFVGPDYATDRGYVRVWNVGEATADEVVAEGLAVATELTAPWLLHLHFYDPHDPYAPPEAYLEGLGALPPVELDLGSRQGVATLAAAWNGLDAATQAAYRQHLDLRYAGELRFLDDQLAELFRALGQPAADTAVLLISDHGEGLGDHGMVTHGGTLHGSENDAIATLWAPGRAPAGVVDWTSHADLLPWLWAALGFPPDADFTGSIPGQGPDHRFLLRFDGDGVALHGVVTGQDKLLYNSDGWRGLYDAPSSETEDRYPAADPAIGPLWALLGPEIERVRGLFPDYAPVDPGP